MPEHMSRAELATMAPAVAASTGGQGAGLSCLMDHVSIYLSASVWKAAGHLLT